ncbi:MAG: hypothetical protein ACRDTT_22555, partial [Pseudonocardiaceae bacterium]
SRVRSRPAVKILPERSDISRMGRPRSGYRRSMRAPHDEDGLRGEVGQTLALFGMSLAVVLVGLLLGMGL